MVRCCWGACHLQPGNELGVRVPFAKLRSKYRNADGEKVGVQAVLPWRTDILSRCGIVDFTEPDKEYRLCKRHFPDHAFDTNGHLVYPHLPDEAEALGANNSTKAFQALCEGMQDAKTRNKKKVKVHLADAVRLHGLLEQYHVNQQTLRNRLKDLEDRERLVKESLDSLHQAELKVAAKKAFVALSMAKVRTLSDQACYRLTGLRGGAVVDQLYEWINVSTNYSANSLVLFRGANTPSPSKARESTRSLDGPDQFLFTLFVLRTGNTLAVAATLFGISPTSATRYFTTWLECLSNFFRITQPPPSQAYTQATMTKAFKKAFGTDRVRIVLDTTNVNLQCPSDPDVQKAFYSKYYGGTFFCFFCAFTIDVFFFRCSSTTLSWWDSCPKWNERACLSQATWPRY